MKMFVDGSPILIQSLEIRISLVHDFLDAWCIYVNMIDCKLFLTTDCRLNMRLRNSNIDTR